MKSMPITTEGASSNTGQARYTRYSIQLYAIMLVSDLWQSGGFLRVLRFLPPIKLTARK